MYIFSTHSKMLRNCYCQLKYSSQVDMYEHGTIQNTKIVFMSPIYLSVSPE